MTAITYRITLLEPALVTALDGDPNSSVALDYLPGSVLRGAIIKKYMQNNSLRELDAGDSATRRLFFNGSTRYLNGYPLDRLAQRALPTPASWRFRKGNENDIADFALGKPEDDNVQWVRVGKPFCTLDGNETRLIRPDRQINVHTARTRRFGRAMPQDKTGPEDNPGAVFRYEALAAGQAFEAVVLCDHPSDANMLESLLEGEVRIGGSRSGGYGLAQLGDVKIQKGGWREVGPEPISDTGSLSLIVTLLSDTLVRDANGQYVVDSEVITDMLAALSGIRLNLRDAFLHSRSIGGFNRKWGLPLPQALSVAMGSVLVYDMPDCDETGLHTLEWQGIGERRAEGFGRLAFNWQSEEALTVEAPDITSREELGISEITDPVSRDLAIQMTQRMLRRYLDSLVLAAAQRLRCTTAALKPIKTAQISRLRNILHDELAKETPDLQRIQRYLATVRERRTAYRQFERAQIGNQSLWNWLNKTLATTEESEWRSLFDFDSNRALAVGNIRAEITETLRTRYLIRFIDATLARAAKLKRGEE